MNKLARIAVVAKTQTRNDPNTELLSIREREVMSLAAEGMTNKQIARKLNITVGTVKCHLHRVYQKLGVRGRFALAALVMKSSQGQTQ